MRSRRLGPLGIALAVIGAFAFAVPVTGAEGAASPQWSNAAAVDGAACVAALKASGAKFTAHKPQSAPDKKGCGMPNPVTVSKGPTGIVYSPALVIDCSLAAELPAIEAIVQDEARAWLGAEIKRIDGLGSYACRSSNGPATRAWAGRPVLSEHAFGLAFDVKAFAPKKGPPISILKDWGKADPKGRFLAEVRRRIRAETGITHVITPDYNAAHRDHLHIDRGLGWGWWWSGS